MDRTCGNPWILLLILTSCTLDKNKLYIIIEFLINDFKCVRYFYQVTKRERRFQYFKFQGDIKCFQRKIF